MKLFSQDGLPRAGASGTKRWALLIGINTYPFLGEVNLDGSVNDALGYKAVLQERFDFPEENITLLLDEAATHEAILNALDRLVAVSQDGDQVVLSYSGHGRRIASADSLESDQMDETFVPADSGSGFYPNRDIRDDEFLSRIVALTERGAYVSFFCDCCHSSASLRDDFRASIRGLTADLRRNSVDEQMPQAPRWLDPSGGVGDRRPLPVAAVPGARPAKPDVGLRRDRYVYVAACRDAELATEHIEHTEAGRQVHGALSFYLQRELASCQSGDSMQQVIRRAFAALSAECPQQHPRAEGALHDAPLFVAESIAAKSPVSRSQAEPHALVRERIEKSVVLSVGRLHGETVGSRYAVYAASGAPTPWGESRQQRIGWVEVSVLRATSLLAKIVQEDPAGSIAPGCVAIEREHQTVLSPLRIELCCDPDHTENTNLVTAVSHLHELLSGVPTVEQVRDGSASLRLYALAARSQPSAGEGVDVAVPSAPVPQLGALSEPVWALVGREGRLRAPAQPLQAEDSLERIGQLVVALATQRLVLDLAPRVSRLRDALQVDLAVCRPGTTHWQPVSPSEGALPLVEEGDELSLRVQARSAVPDLPGAPSVLHVAVLYLSASGETQVWTSAPENPPVLDRSGGWVLGAHAIERRVLRIAPGYPPTGWDSVADPRVDAREAAQSPLEPAPASEYVQDVIKVFVSTRPLQASLIAALRVTPATAARDASLRGDAPESARQLARALRGVRVRRRPLAVLQAEDATLEDWTQISLPLIVRRTSPG